MRRLMIFFFVSLLSVLVLGLFASCSDNHSDVAGFYIGGAFFEETGYKTFVAALWLNEDLTASFNLNTASSNSNVGYIGTYNVDGDRVTVTSEDGSSRAVFSIQDDGSLTFLVSESTDMSKYDHDYPFDFTLTKRAGAETQD